MRVLLYEEGSILKQLAQISMALSINPTMNIFEMHPLMGVLTRSSICNNCGSHGNTLRDHPKHTYHGIGTLGIFGEVWDVAACECSSLIAHNVGFQAICYAVVDVALAIVEFISHSYIIVCK